MKYCKPCYEDFYMRYIKGKWVLGVYNVKLTSIHSSLSDVLDRSFVPLATLNYAPNYKNTKAAIDEICASWQSYIESIKAEL